MDIILSTEQVRVLGCLMEKKMATPDYYPLSLNALTSGPVFPARVQVDWFADGQGLDLPMWRHSLEGTGRRVHVELLGQLVTGLAAVDPGGAVAR